MESNHDDGAVRILVNLNQKHEVLLIKEEQMLFIKLLSFKVIDRGTLSLTIIMSQSQASQGCVYESSVHITSN